MRRGWFALLLVVLVGCGAATASSSFRAAGPPVPLPRSGSLEPTSADRFEGMVVGQRGKVVVINVWASWCAPCRTEAPLLQRASESYDSDVTFIGVDSQDDRAAGSEFMEEFGLTYPNVFDHTGDIADRLGLRGFPTTYILGRDGRVRATVLGGISEQKLAAQLEDALRQ